MGASVYIGAGGWAYLCPAGGGDKLAAYSRLFNFVEVNSTFYTYVPSNVMRSWRARVPSDFVFSVRCHRDLTHKFGLRPCEESFGVFERMVAACRVLRAPILHLQTPSLFEWDRKACSEARDFFASVLTRDVKIALEVRGGLNHGVLSLMADLGILPCVDISREELPFQTEVLYTRLFGRGYHTLYEFDDEELMGIGESVRRGGYKRAYLVFHSLRMYEDAERLKVHLETGLFPQGRGKLGLDALKEVLSAVRFPRSRGDIIKRVGWRSIDTSSGRRVHVSKILEKIPERRYFSVDDVLGEVSLYYPHI